MLITYLMDAYKGRVIWEYLKRRYGNGRHPSRYVLFPDDDREYHAWALYFLEEFIEKKHLGKVNLLTVSKELARAAENIPNRQLHTILIRRSWMDCLIRYSALVCKNAEWTIISVKHPYDTGAERLLGKKGVTRKEIVWYDMLRMPQPMEQHKRIRTDKWKHAEMFCKYYDGTGSRQE